MQEQRYLRTKDLAAAVGISVQQVRNDEASGLLPPVERSASGYRRYTERHLAALKTGRLLIAGCGLQRAQQIMQALHQHQLDTALALIDARHAELHQTRQQLDETLAALSVLAAQPPPRQRRAQRLRVGQAARRAGVEVSALHFWEAQGLLQPVRDQRSNYRLYDEPQLRRLHIIVLLRQASYDIPAIRATLSALDAGQPEHAVAAIEQRRRDLASTSWKCVAATAALHAYVIEHLPAERTTQP